ncbi:MAG: hypothetical protein JSV34_03640 [Candidatus Omnitrophota bacterium]|nr:MAG: hypothetical protein JSV34_03640 [Candidatus Omnitrophota bacterium]
MRCKTHALLEINHSVKQKEYVEWKYNVLLPLTVTPPKLRKSGHKRFAYRFTTKSLEVLTNFYKRFYQQGVKVIPENLEISPLSLAVWFMDDGCKSRRAIYLNTQNFSVQDQRKLVQLLKTQYGIKASLNRDKKYYRLRIAVESVEKFHSLVFPFVLPCFLYKLPLRPCND